VPVVRLTEIFRQAAESRIIINAHRINQGLMPDLATVEGGDFYFVDAADPEDGVRKLDLIETRGERGKRLAAAKDAGFLDVALACARDLAAEPATLVRAARDFAAKEPKFAAEIGLIASGRLLNGGGYDPEISLVQGAFRHLTDSASRIGACDWAKQQVRALVDGPCDSSRRHYQRVLAECLGRCGEEPVRE
jgi:hypothetical protein